MILCSSLIMTLLCVVINVRVCVVFRVLLVHIGEVGEPFVTFDPYNQLRTLSFLFFFLDFNY